MKTSLCIVAITASSRLPNKALLNIIEIICLLDLLILRLKTEFNQGIYSCNYKVKTR